MMYFLLLYVICHFPAISFNGHSPVFYYSLSCGNLCIHTSSPGTIWVNGTNWGRVSLLSCIALVQKAKLQPMGWVSGILILHNWGVAENNCRKGEGRKTHPKPTIGSVGIVLHWLTHPNDMLAATMSTYWENTRNVKLASHQICWLNHAKQHDMSYQQDVSQHAGGFFWT